MKVQIYNELIDLRDILFIEMIGGNKLNKSLIKPIRVLGFAVPLFIVMFGAILQFFNPSTTTPEILKFFALSIAWIALACAQFVSNKYPKIVLILYHLLAMLSILTMYKEMAPFISFWILLSLASYIRYKEIGLALSLISLLFTLTVNTALTSSLNSATLAYEVSTYIAVLTASYVIVILSRAQNDARQQLHNSKTRETLQRNRLLSIINNQSDGIISTDLSGNIRVFNAASMWLLNTNQDLIGKNINKVFPLYDLDKKAINTLKQLSSYKTNTTRDDLLFKSEDGEMLRFEVTFAPIRQAYGVKTKQKDDLDGYILIFRDVTKEKSLDDERNEFISVVSHELRTPVTVAEGAISNASILFDSPKVPKAAAKESIDMAHTQILYLANLINDLSTLSRAQRDVMNEPESIIVRELGFQILQKYTASASKKGLTLDLDMPGHLGSVFTSRLYLEELMQNLVSNAIKYTQSGSVTIKITRKNDLIKFAVQDTGIGISRSEREKIFDKFYRSEDYRTRESSGTGLGLYLSAQLADKMGTWLKLTSRMNHGSTFFFELPTHKVENNGSKK